MSKGNVGTQTNMIINTRNTNKKMIKCNCKNCVNLSRGGCRFGWEPIKGKCRRYGTNDYILSKEEVNETREQTIVNREYMKKEKEENLIQVTFKNKRRRIYKVIDK